MTTTIIIVLISGVVWSVILGLWFRDLAREVKSLRDAHRRIVNDYVRVAESRAEIRHEINSLADVVAKNADRTTRLEGEDAPRRPACPQTYIMTTYPKRADEV